MIARPWTDDLPKCKDTSVVSYFSQLGGGNANSNSDDYLCFHCQTEDNCCLYGLFEPHNGLFAARFIMQRMAAELLFPPPSAVQTPDEVTSRLRNAFVSVEKAYIENYDGMIAERTSLQYQLQSASETQKHEILMRLKEIDQDLSGSATVVIALVLQDKLYVANVGEARALLCRTDDNSVLRVVQLSADHSVNNEDELLRLQQLGLDVNKLRNGQYLGNQAGTRCLGNYLVKGLYRAFGQLTPAKSEPVIAVPEIHGPCALDHYSRFLVLVSAGVYKRIQEARGSSEQTNKQVAQIIVEHFRNTTNFKTVSQSVLQDIEDEFVTYCFKNNLTPKPSTHMSLIIRNFNFPLPNVPLCIEPKTSVRFNPIVQSKSNTLLNLINNDTDSQQSIDSNKYNSNADSNTTNRSDSNSSDVDPQGKVYDKDRRIKGYVDFSCYYENVDRAKKSGKILPSFIK